MKKLTVAILASAVVGVFGQPAVAATDWEFKRAEVRQMKLRGIISAFKEQTGRDSIFKNRSDANLDLRGLISERRQAIRSRLVGRLKQISDRRIARAVRFAERYANGGLDIINERIPEEYEELPWERPGFGGEENGMPEVPLPASVWLLGSGIAFLGWRARRRAV